MRYILLLFNLFLGCLPEMADDYKVLFVNDEKLKFVSGKSVKVGDLFSDVKDIDWQEEKQAVKAINMTTKKQTLFVGKYWVKKGGIKALMHQRHLSTHDGSKEGTEGSLYEKLQKVFDDEYELLDTIEVRSDIEPSETSYFEVSYEYDHKRYYKAIKQQGDTVIIDRSIFYVEGKWLEPRDIELSIDYVDSNTGISVFVKDSVKIEIIPENL